MENVVLNLQCNKNELKFNLLGREWLFLRPACLEELWDTLASDNISNDPGELNCCTNRVDVNRLLKGFVEDERIPYWTELWPAGFALADWLYEKRDLIQGRICLDLGCGLGLTALAGASLGGKVLGMDYELEALYYAAKNENNLPPSIAEQAPCWLAADWRRPCFKNKSLPLIWAGDIMYEERFVDPVADFLDHCLAPDGLAWIAEPCRGVYPKFARQMQERGWQVYIAARKQASLPGAASPEVDVQIWELKRNA